MGEIHCLAGLGPQAFIGEIDCRETVRLAGLKLQPWGGKGFGVKSVVLFVAHCSPVGGKTVG